MLKFLNNQISVVYLYQQNKTIGIMRATNTQIQTVNNFWNSFENLTSADYRAWVKQLNELKAFLCDTQYWNELVENIEIVKSKY